mmetsp:Transcript_8738/g.22622  ORF Transcript_8738/g.22622 Transcript_8738/m.22622 type:complete len:160 (+) Transcript_8738:48-527(+)
MTSVVLSFVLVRQVFLLGLFAGLLTPRGGCSPREGASAHDTQLSSAGVTGAGMHGGNNVGSGDGGCADCVCIANREDNMIHIGMVTVAECAAFSSKTGLPSSELNCDKWSKAPEGSAAPPKSCDTSWGRADWIFSTMYQLTGAHPPPHAPRRARRVKGR